MIIDPKSFFENGLTGFRARVDMVNPSKWWVLAELTEDAAPLMVCSFSSPDEAFNQAMAITTAELFNKHFEKEDYFFVYVS